MEKNSKRKGIGKKSLVYPFENKDKYSILFFIMNREADYERRFYALYPYEGGFRKKDGTEGRGTGARIRWQPGAHPLRRA